MSSLHDSLNEYRKQLGKGEIQIAYKGLMEYMMGLRAYFQTKYPAYVISGSIYTGYMDMTYFSVSPAALKQRNLKVAIVFLHEAFRFEVWLAGTNKSYQAEYYQFFKASGWQKYRLVTPGKGVDSILEHILVEEPNFNDLDALTARIETGTLKFIADVTDFLTQQAG